jgi:ketosteroid isomerase-like protein
MRSLAFVLVLAACGGGSRPAAKTTPASSDASGPAGVVEQWKQAWELRSADALAPLYSHGPDLVVVEQGTPTIGWSAVQASLQTRTGQATQVHIQLDTPSVTPLGTDAAIVNVTMSREIDDAGGAVTEHGALTLVVSREGDHWVIVAEHYSHPTSVE